MAVLRRSMFSISALAALVIEAVIGYPQTLVRRIGHPVMWLGALIAWADRRWDRGAERIAARRLRGVVLVDGLLGLMTAVGMLLTWCVQIVLPEPFSTGTVGVIASSLLALRSLDQL